jgi:peptidoglycan/xylan/chitin deacetylase (PgdA/CDA1 family)
MKKGLIFAMLFALLGITAQPVIAASVAQAAPPAIQPQDPGRTQQFIQLASGWTQAGSAGGEAQLTGEPNPDLVVYLTFDDGPDPKWTPQVLALLEQYHATATFYEIGRNARSYPEISLQVAEDGNTIGLHGYNHLDLTKLGYSDFYLEVVDARAAIADALASDPQVESALTPCLRPPYGAVNQDVYAYAAQMNYALSFWQIDTRDWSGVSPEEILATVSANITPYKVVLMHDGGEKRENTLLGLALVLHELTLRGYTFGQYCTAYGQAYTP